MFKLGLPALLLGFLIYIVKGNHYFKENAADSVKVSFKRTIRMGVNKVDYTKLEIVAKPLLMVVNNYIVDTNRVTIEIKPDNEPWRVVEETPNIRGGVFTWTVNNVSPCKNHALRIWVYRKDNTQNSF